MLQAGQDHPNFERILAGALADDESVVELFDLEAKVAQKFESLSERVSVANGRVYFDNEEVNNSLATQILNFLNEDDDKFKSLVLFFENVANNPSKFSQEQLFSWLNDRDFAITEDGCFVAYKGVRKLSDDKFESISHGTAIVDGEVFTGGIPNYEGAVVTMPRSEVAFDPQQGCSYGLHAGTWEYANDFAQGATLTVKINPRDVVSVPVDCDAQKLRVCRYTVLEVVEQPYSGYYVDTAPESPGWGEAEDAEPEEIYNEEYVDDDDDDEYDDVPDYYTFPNDGFTY